MTSNSRPGDDRPALLAGESWSKFVPTGNNAEYVELENATFVTYRGPSADAYAFTYDHDTDQRSAVTKLGVNPLPDRDQHGPPSLAIDRDGYLHVFYGCHGRDIQYVRSDRPYDTTSWNNTEEGGTVEANSLEEIVGGTYTYPVTYDGDVYVLYRTGARHFHDREDLTYPSHEFATIARSTDGGETWEDRWAPNGEGPVIDTYGFVEARDEDWIRTTDAYVNDMSLWNDELHVTLFLAYGEEHDGRRGYVIHAAWDLARDTWVTPDGQDVGEVLTWDAIRSTDAVVFTDFSLSKTKHAYNPETDTIHVAWMYRPESRDTPGEHPPGMAKSQGVSRVMHAAYDGADWTVERVSDDDHPAAFRGVCPVIEDGEFVHYQMSEGALLRYTKDDGEWNREIAVPAPARGRISSAGRIHNASPELKLLFSVQPDSAANVVSDSNNTRQFRKLYGYGTVAGICRPLDGR